MNQENSKYNVFIENYNSNLNQHLNKISDSFFSRINFDKKTIIELVDEEFVKGKLRQIDEIQNDSTDYLNKLKLTGKILFDIAPFLISNKNIEIQRSGANIINSFFDVAKQTEDRELLQTAVEISELNKK